MVFSYPARIDFSKPPSSEVAAAIATQNDLRTHVRLEDDFGKIKTVAGVDVGYDLERNLAKAVIAVMDWESLTLQTSVIAYETVTFPYISGLLSFREIPAILKGLSCLERSPDLLMVDGQGVAHPRRLGIAAHLGVLTNLPSIGVAKSRLTGKYDPLPLKKLSTTPLMDKGEQVGTVLRSKEKCNPLFISAGHRISQPSALTLALHCIGKYRLPEPTRLADYISKWKIPSDTKNLPPGETEDFLAASYKEGMNRN